MVNVGSSALKRTILLDSDCAQDKEEAQGGPSEAKVVCLEHVNVTGDGELEDALTLKTSIREHTNHNTAEKSLERHSEIQNEAAVVKAIHFENGEYTGNSVEKGINAVAQINNAVLDKTSFFH